MSERITQENARQFRLAASDLSSAAGHVTHMISEMRSRDYAAAGQLIGWCPNADVFVRQWQLALAKAQRAMGLLQSLEVHVLAEAEAMRDTEVRQ